jgi:hypothetical protein
MAKNENVETRNGNEMASSSGVKNRKSIEEEKCNGNQ